ncbi:MAG: hypothetical protein KJI72_03820 [Patescibacteria group bacterium]|nr:hypothetical protein [Patescibacteria group bacterium]
MAKQQPKRSPKMITSLIRNLLDELDSVTGSGSKPLILKGNKTQSYAPQHSGVVGGIRLLHEEEFLSEPRTVAQIGQELRKKGYIYRREVVSMALLRLVRRGILTRLPEGGNWKYVARK